MDAQVLRLIIISLSCSFSNSIDPVSLTGFGAAAAALFYKFSCDFIECCDKSWIPNNTTELKRSLQNEVFGQNLAVSLVYNQIAAHIENNHPSKALVMSFNGWTGSGKNHVANITAYSLYRKGLKSKYVHHFMATVHFPHAKDAHTYEDQLRGWVKGNVTHCPQSLFIFDEVEKMPPGILDGIKPYLDHHDEVDGVDYRKSIFIFLSNSGGAEITKKVLQTWQDGKVKREELTYKDFEALVLQGTFNEKGGLYQSSLIDRSLIDLYVPFLPLERRHIQLCARNEFLKSGHKPSSEDLIAIAEKMTYYPEDLQLFSTTGCKKVSSLVGRYLTHLRHKHLFD